ncbi:MAG: response regulator [Synergistaceae bacterium]|jgi:putative two-component system response regulator|nr:response regulator [Synergistaceae bacterium]
MANIRRKIMLVDDNLTNLTMGKNMLKSFYEVYPLTSGKKLFEMLENVTPDLILLDIEMPEMNGYDVIKALKSDEHFREIPVIFLTAKSGDDNELEGLCLGAIDYVQKPFSAPLLLKRIENHLLITEQKRELKNYNDNLEELVNLKTSQIMELQVAVMGTVAEMVEFRDHSTGGHVDRTIKYLEILVDGLLDERIYSDELKGLDLRFLILSAQLHDVGKIAISDTILKKPGRLTAEEFEEMKTHTTIGAEAIARIGEHTAGHSFLHHAKIIAHTHHEKWDGTGYPLGLKGAEIPLEGRLMAIADVYDALISMRPYKPPLSADDAARIVKEGRGVHFDPLLVDIFEKLSGKFAKVSGEIYRPAPETAAAINAAVESPSVSGAWRQPQPAIRRRVPAFFGGTCAG